MAYFLRPTGDTTGAVHRYALYRRQRAVVPDNHFVNWESPVVLRVRGDPAPYGEVSCQKRDPDPSAYPDTVYFNNPTDLTVPQRRFGMSPTRDGGWPLRADGSYPVFGDPMPAGLRS